MNPNREHIDDDVVVEVNAAADFKAWLTSPPRRRRRDAFALVIGGSFLGSLLVLPEWGTVETVVTVLVTGGLLGQLAEVLPADSLRTAKQLRVLSVVLALAGVVLFSVTMILA